LQKESCIMTIPRRRRLAPLLAALFAVLLVTAACTPHEQAVFRTLSPAQQQAVLAHLNSAPPAYGKHGGVLSDPQLARLRQCESGGNYSITNPSGKYRGAYQFDRPTWDGVAARHYPHLRGVDPARAAPRQQDAMARALWSERGRKPWPHCGRRI